MFRHNRMTVALAGLLCLAAFVTAQDDSTRPIEQQRNDAIRGLSRPGESDNRVSSRGDAQIAACLVIDNKHEIALSQFAQQHARDAEVKRFAQRMVVDHQHLVGRLHPFATAGGYDFSRTTAAGTAANVTTSNPDRHADKATDTRRETAEEALRREAATRARATTGPESGLDLVHIRQEIADRCLQSTRRSLEEKPAIKFDKCYIAGQIVAHQQMVDALEVLENYTSPDLAPVLRDALNGARAHLEQAKGLEARLEETSRN